MTARQQANMWWFNKFRQNTSFVEAEDVAALVSMVMAWRNRPQQQCIFSKSYACFMSSSASFIVPFSGTPDHPRHLLLDLMTSLPGISA